MSSKTEERNLSQVLGSVPKVHNQRSFSSTVTIVGVGLSDITVQDVRAQLSAQHQLVTQGTQADQMYVHRIRAYGTAGGYLSMAPYPHRQYCGFPNTNGGVVGSFFNSYTSGNDTEGEFRRGSLTQMYEFGINGATRPELTWEYPETEVINNPFTLDVTFIQAQGLAAGQQVNNLNKLVTVQSTNTAGNALYIIQFDVTIRSSRFIEIAPALGAAAFGERNVLVDDYKPPHDLKEKEEDGRKAEELANKKRKVENVKALTMPALDSH